MSRTSVDRVLSELEGDSASSAGAADAGGGPRARHSAVSTGDVPAEETVVLRARKVDRIVLRLDSLSVLKVALVFGTCAWIVITVAGVVIWNAAAMLEVTTKIEGFIEDLFGLERFEFRPTEMLRGALLGGAVAVPLGSLFAAIMAGLFNLVSELVGGVHMEVLEVEALKRADVERVGAEAQEPGASAATS